MKYSLVIFSFLFLIIFTFSSTAQETAKANKGEGVLQFLKRFNRTKSFHFDRFIELNRDKLNKNNGLKLGVTYTLPPLQNEGNEPLFGEKLAKYTIDSDELNGACFYLVSGHGGPDPGAIGELRGHPLHEDEYAYDIMLRLARNLMSKGAKVHIIIQDAKDGIRNDKFLDNLHGTSHSLEPSQTSATTLRQDQRTIQERQGTLSPGSFYSPRQPKRE